MARAFISGGVLVEIQLVVLFRIPPRLGGQDLGDDLAVPPLLIGLLGDLVRDRFLLGRMIKDPAAVLGPSVGTLLVRGGGVVHPVEELEQLGVGNFGGVVN